MTRSLLLLLAAFLTLGFATPAFADVADGSDGSDGSDGTEESEEDSDEGCSHVGRMATPATGLSLLTGGALLLGMRRRD